MSAALEGLSRQTLHPHIIFLCRNPILSHNKENRFLISNCCDTAICVKCFQEALRHFPDQINLEHSTDCSTKKSRSREFQIIDIRQRVLRNLYVWELIEYLGEQNL